MDDEETPRRSWSVAIFEALPFPAFVVDEDLRILDHNAAAAAFMPAGRDAVLHRKSGEALRCLNAEQAAGGCGASPACRDCVIRNAVQRAARGGEVHRAKTRVSLRSEGSVKDLYLLITAAPFDHSGAPYIFLLLEDISELVRLQGLLPVCAWCRKIRTQGNYWESLEEYLGSRFDVDVTHSICEDCLASLKGEARAEPRSRRPG